MEVFWSWPFGRRRWAAATAEPQKQHLSPQVLRLSTILYKEGQSWLPQKVPLPKDKGDWPPHEISEIERCQSWVNWIRDCKRGVSVNYIQVILSMNQWGSLSEKTSQECETALTSQFHSLKKLLSFEKLERSWKKLGKSWKKIKKKLRKIKKKKIEKSWEKVFKKNKKVEEKS